MQVQRYKNTELGEIPEEWKVIKLEDASLLITDGVHFTPKYLQSGIPFISVNNLSNGKIDFTNCKYISEDSHKQLIKRCNPKRGDILLSKVGTLGIADIIDVDFEFSIFVQLCLIKPNRKIIYANYLKYLLNSQPMQKRIESNASGSTLKYIGINKISNLVIPIPPLTEQKKIASILSNVDNLIQKTDQIIEQTQRLNKGLMQRLLTKGIGHIKFKKTELGEIPEEWDIVKIKDIASINPESITERYAFENINYIEIGAIKDYEIQNYIPYDISKRPSRAQRIVKYKDIIVSTVRPYLKGFSRITDKRSNLVCSTGFAVIRTKKIEDSDFVFNYVKSKNFENAVSKQMEGMAYPAITSSDVANVSIPYPKNPHEKLKLSSILFTIDLKFKLSILEKRKLEHLKKGLMQQLLTGKIRVKV